MTSVPSEGGRPIAFVNWNAKIVEMLARMVATRKTTDRCTPYLGRVGAGRSVPVPRTSSSRSAGGFIGVTKDRSAGAGRIFTLDVRSSVFVLSIFQIQRVEFAIPMH